MLQGCQLLTEQNKFTFFSPSGSKSVLALPGDDMEIEGAGGGDVNDGCPEVALLIQRV